jgi:hypothetical protein
MLATVPAWAEPFNEVPAGNWSYSACARLVSLGLLPAERSTDFSGRPALTRFEFATAILQPLSEVDRARRALPAKSPTGTVRETAADALSLDPKVSELEISGAASDLIHLAAEFESELQILGFVPTQAVHALQLLADPVAAREWRTAALSHPLLLPALRPGETGQPMRVALGHGAVALDYDRSLRAPEFLDSLARLTSSGPGGTPSRGGGSAAAALSDPSISRLRTAYEYVLGSGLTLSVGREEIARRGSNLLPLDAATLTSLGIGYPVTPSASVKVSYSLLDYQSYVTNAPPVRERVAETAVSIQF